MKQVLSIQDLSCLGKCSLTVALPVLSGMGCSCAVLPTAVLSTHTAFPAPHVHSLTGTMGAICRHWQSVGVRFDTVSIGYLSDPAQAAAVEQVLQAFPAKVILDPAMGDHGRLYGGLGDGHISAMAKLCAKAHILLPNVTEAALLTGLPYRETSDLTYYRTLLDGMRRFGAEGVIITGVSLSGGQTGFMGLDDRGEFSYQTEDLPMRCHGTGDLFAAVFTGAYARGKGIRDAATLGARFVAQVLSATEDASPFGLHFEPWLPWLWEHM